MDYKSNTQGNGARCDSGRGSGHRLHRLVCWLGRSMRFSGEGWAGKAPFRSRGRAPWKTAMKVATHLARGVSGTSCVDDACRARVREPASRNRAFRALPTTDFPGTCRLPSFRPGFQALPGSDPAGGRNGFQDVAPPGSAVPSTRDRRVRRRSRFGGPIRPIEVPHPCMRSRPRWLNSR